MQKLLLLCVATLLCGGLFAQPIFVDQFDDDQVTTGDTDKFDVTEANGELNIAGNGTNGPWDIVYYGFGSTLDLSENAKVFIRARASVAGTQLRVDLADTNNANTDAAPQTITLTGEYRVVELDFGSIDVGSVDLSSVNAMYFFINGGTAGFTGQVAIDYIAIGEEPAGVIMSDIYQDHMDSDSSLANWVNFVPGFTRERRTGPDGDSTVVTLVGDGTAGPWTPHAYALRPAPEFIQTNIDMSDNPLIYVKMRTSVPGTSLRIDVQDVDNISSIGNAITRILTDEYEVYEFDFTGAFQTFPTDACPTADVDPCDVNLEAIKELLIYVNGGTGQFAGTIDVDWISFGVNLDGEGPEAELVYADDFDNNVLSFVGPTDGFEVTEEGGNLVINGDGTSGQFGTISYQWHEATDDQDTAFVSQVLNVDPAQGKVFIRARTLGAPQTLRIDLLDTAGLATNFAGLTKRITNEWAVYTYDFNGNYGDAGYGGAEGCTPQALCFIDETAVREIFFYVRPGEGLFDGTIEIDWLSVGQPLSVDPPSEPGVVNYSDELNDVGEFLTGGPSGVTFGATEDGTFTLAGDGTSPTYQQVALLLRDEAGNSGKADVAGSNDILYVRARLTGDDEAVLRIDLIDEDNFQTTNAGAANTIAGEDFVVYEFNYANLYEDGGYGGTACSNGPCPVDAQRITALNFYPDPDTGGFEGTIEIDYVAFGEPLVVDAAYDFAELESMRLFPNPATDVLAVEYDLATASSISVSLFDGLGRRVMVRDFGQRGEGNHFHRLDVSELATGNYYLQVTVNGTPARAQTLVKK